MLDRKINVLVVPSDMFGCGWYRSLSPHLQLDKMYKSDFNVEINYQPNWKDLESFEKYDIVHFHKGLYNDMDDFWDFLKYAKEKNIVTIMDVDDNWDVGPQHPMYLSNKMARNPEKTIQNFRLSDYVTTTTKIFADKIKPYNKNVFVYQNAIDPTEEQYQPIKEKSDRIRFGFVMGSSHEKDMEQFRGVANMLSNMGILDKIQLVLCGYDLRGTINIVDKDGNYKGNRPIKPAESVWYKYEQNVTDDYNIVSPHYKEFLLKFLYNAQWPFVEQEPYRREWTRDISEFAKHYRHLDVLLAPLDVNPFNEVKSELKFVEAGFTHTALICSNFGPYTLISKNLIQKYGEIDKDGNCILIDSNAKAKDWAKAIKKLAMNPELITTLQDNLYNSVKDIYDIRNVTKKRAEWYKSIVRKES